MKIYHSSPLTCLPWQKERQQLAYSSPHARLPWQKRRSRGVTSTIAQRKHPALSFSVFQAALELVNGKESRRIIRNHPMRERLKNGLQESSMKKENNNRKPRKRFSLDLLILLGQAKRITSSLHDCLPWQKEKQQLPYSSPLERRSRGVTSTIAQRKHPALSFSVFQAALELVNGKESRRIIRNHPMRERLKNGLQESSMKKENNNRKPRKRFSLDLLILLGQAKRITYFPLTCLPSQKVRQKPTNPSPLEGRSRGVTNL